MRGLTSLRYRSAEFECAEGRERELTDQIGGGVFQGGFDALKRHFSRR